VFLNLLLVAVANKTKSLLYCVLEPLLYSTTESTLAKLDFHRFSLKPELCMYTVPTCPTFLLYVFSLVRFSTERPTSMSAIRSLYSQHVSIGDDCIQYVRFTYIVEIEYNKVPNTIYLVFYKSNATY
jgi:hypothetical protein